MLLYTYVNPVEAGLVRTMKDISAPTLGMKQVARQVGLFEKINPGHGEKVCAEIFHGAKAFGELGEPGKESEIYQRARGQHACGRSE